MVKKRMMLGIICACMFLSPSIYAQGRCELEEMTVNVASTVGKAVVSISSVIKEKAAGSLYFSSPFEDSEDDFFQRFFEEFFGEVPEREYKRMILGSGVIIDKEGHILTNEHVVSGASQVKVNLPDGREFDAKIKGMDKRSDLALIKVDARDLPAAKLGDSDGLRIGEWVVAIGNPFGPYLESAEPTVTVGVISALHRYLPSLEESSESNYDDLIQTDAAINPGNSGGPLVDLDGKIIGINTAILSRTGGYQGLGFAISINKAKKILSKLLKGEKILYGWLGINIQDLNDDLRNYFGIKEKEGVIVLKVNKDSPAEKGGIEEGDLILTFNKQPIRTTRDLVKMISSSEAGETVPIKIIRSSKVLDLKVKIGTMTQEGKDTENVEETTSTFRGMTVNNLTPFYKQKFGLKIDKGVIITGVEDGSAADKSGVRAGDVIIKIESKKIQNKNDFDEAVTKITGSFLLKTDRGYFVVKSAD
ncbi:MAG: Do family serine endopeptidase [Candidatus Omnitrophota bacterium]